MTNKERLIGLLGFSPNSNAIDGALIDAGITGSDEYDGSGLTGMKAAQLEILKLLFTTPDTTNENGYAIKYDRGSLIKAISDLEDELGITGRPVISSVSPW